MVGIQTMTLRDYTVGAWKVGKLITQARKVLSTTVIGVAMISARDDDNSLPL